MPTTNSLAAQMKHRDRDMVPKVLVQAMFTLMIAAVVLVAYARLTDRPVIGVATAQRDRGGNSNHFGGQ